MTTHNKTAKGSTSKAAIRSKNKIERGSIASQTVPAQKTDALNHNDIKLWKPTLEESIAHQRQAQITWWSILQGLSVAALLLEAPNVIERLGSQEWHTIIYFISSALITVNLWLQYAWGSLILRWRLSVIHTILAFSMGITFSIAIPQIKNPMNWFIIVSLFILFAIAHLIHNIKTKAWIQPSEKWNRRPKSTITAYTIFLLTAITASVHLYISPSTNHEIFWGIIALIESLASLSLQHIQMQIERVDSQIP